MNNAKILSTKVQKLFSIPGRIRLGLIGLKGNSNLALYVENIFIKFPNVESVHVNIKTGNILLIYNSYCIDEDRILKYIYETSIPAQYWKHEMFKKIKRSSTDLYKDEKYLSRSLLTISVAAASILFLTASPISAISSIVLGFPGIIYLNSYLSSTYTRSKACLNEVYVKNIETINSIQNIKNILIHSSVVFDNDKLERLQPIDCLKIESLISTGAVEDPIRSEVRTLIKDLRSIGINHLYIISDDENSIFLYANRSLGLDHIGEKEFPEILIINDNSLDTTKTMDNRIIVSLSESKKKYVRNIHVRCHEIDKIPWLIKNCMDSKEYLTRSQTAAVSLNILGMMLIFVRYIGLSGSLILYLINIFGNTLYLKRKILHYKELSNEEKTGFRNAQNRAVRYREKG